MGCCGDDARPSPPASHMLVLLLMTAVQWLQQRQRRRRQAIELAWERSCCSRRSSRVDAAKRIQRKSGKKWKGIGKREKDKRLSPLSLWCSDARPEVIVSRVRLRGLRSPDGFVGQTSDSCLSGVSFSLSPSTRALCLQLTLSLTNCCSTTAAAAVAADQTHEGESETHASRVLLPDSLVCVTRRPASFLV